MLSRHVSSLQLSLTLHALIYNTGTNSIVRYPAVVQSLKGLVSAGPVKGARYTAAKIGKWWNGSKKSASS
jgi:translocator assembly and maintenance protein 41